MNTPIHKLQPCGSISCNLTKYKALYWGIRWQCRHCATSRKVAGSIPDVLIEIFHWHNPSSCILAQRSTQSLTEKSTRNISERWKCKADNLTTVLCQLSWNLGNSISWNPQGLSKDCFLQRITYELLRIMIVLNPNYPARKSHKEWDSINVPRPSCSCLLFLFNLGKWNWILSTDFGTVTNTILEENLCLESRGLPNRQTNMTEQICTCFSQQVCRHA
jgi:hypothetical protein